MFKIVPAHPGPGQTRFGPSPPKVGLTAWSVSRVMLCAVIVDFEAELWIWDARRAESWTFVSLPIEAAEEIRDRAAGPPRGFGSVRVRVTVGASTWTTSIFPDG